MLIQSLQLPLISLSRACKETGSDPRERTITVVFTGQIKDQNPPIQASSDAKETKWYSMDNLPELAFDHHEIIHLALSQNRI